MRLKKPAVALATAALMTLAACGGGGGTGPGGGESPGDGQPTLGEGGGAGKGKNAEATGPVPVPEDAQDGGTLTVLTEQVPSTFDPTRAYYTDSTAILSMVTRALTQYVYDPETQDMVLVPDMAEGLGEPNADNTEWTFTLKEGLKYEDGTPVKPEDVAYAIKRSFAIEELPEGPTYQLTFFLNGDKYKGPFKDGLDYEGVEVNGRDITIKMSRPFPEMDYYGSFPLFTAIPQKKDDPVNYGNHPLATGPYKFADYKPGQSLTLVKNEHWDPATDPGRIQAVDKWVFKFGEDKTKSQNIIINDTGEGQTTLTYDNVTPASFRAIQEEQDRLVTGTTPCTYMWYLDMRKIKDLDVRKAIGYAFPYKSYWKSGGEIIGVTRVPSTTLLPPGTAGRVEYDTLGIGGQNTDPQRARELLKKAGAMGYEIKFLYETDDPESVSAKEEVQKGLEAAGFKVTPIATTSEQYREELSDYDSPVNVRSIGWCSDWPTGGSWFPAQWDPDLVGVAGMPNPSNIKVPELDRRIDHILNNLSADEAARAWGELDEWMMTNHYPAVTLGYAGSAMIRGSRVGGMANDNLRGMPTFNQMYITQ